jgi:hypothetical protein
LDLLAVARVLLDLDLLYLLLLELKIKIKPLLLDLNLLLLDQAGVSWISLLLLELKIKIKPLLLDLNLSLEAKQLTGAKLAGVHITGATFKRSRIQEVQASIKIK